MPFNVFDQNNQTGAISVEEFNTGWRNDKRAFYIEDDALAVLINATTDHGEIKKRRNNTIVGITSIRKDLSFSVTPDNNAIEFNIINESTDVSSEELRKISPYDLSITIGNDVYEVIDTMVFLNDNNVGSVNFITGEISINWSGSASDQTVEVTYSYNTLNPILGISPSRDNSRYFLFDRQYVYSYRIEQITKNINRMSDYASSNNLCSFTGTNNNLFYFADYQNVKFFTNGVSGQHFILITGITQDSSAVLSVAGHNLKVDDVVFINEVVGMTEINLKTATVTAVTASNITLDIDSSEFSAYIRGGVIQTLTQSQSGSGIKYFREDGIVNFAPPISENRYLLGCNFLIVFNGILICFGTYEGDSSGNVDYFPLRMRFSAVGNAFYAYETNVFENSWMDALVGSGGFIDFDSTGEEITYARIIDGFLIVGFRYGFSRVSYTFNVEDIFLTYYFPSSLGSESNASAVHMDKYILSFSERGIIATSHNNIERIDSKIFYASHDLDIDNISKRLVNSIRDTEKEYVYISYKSDDTDLNFNDKTIVFNYENNSYALFDERSTYQTNFFNFSFFTINKLDSLFRTFENVPGSFIDYFSDSRTASTAYGTSQGAFIQRTESMEPEENIIVHNALVNDDNLTTFSADNHSVKVGDYIMMKKGIQRTIFRSIATTDNSITIDTLITNYDGTETFHLLYNFDITTKQFATFWSAIHKMDVMEKYFLITANKNFTFSVDSFNIQSSNSTLTDNFIVPARNDADEKYTEWVYSTQSTLSSSIQLKLYFSDTDMRNVDNHISEFCLNKLYIVTTPSGHLTYSGG